MGSQGDLKRKGYSLPLNYHLFVFRIIFVITVVDGLEVVNTLCHCPFPFYFCQVGCAELEREICFCGFYPSLMLAKFQHKLFDWPFSHLSKLSAGTFCHLVFSFTGLWHLTVYFLIWTNDSGDFLSPCCFLIYRSMTIDGPLSSLSKLHRGDCHFKENFLTRSIVILKRIFSLGRVTF